MAKRNNAFLKKQRAEIKKRKKADKEAKKQERKLHSRGGSIENMMAYLDVNGNITSINPGRSGHSV